MSIALTTHHPREVPNWALQLTVRPVTPLASEVVLD